MPPLEELELLSRWQAGELSTDEARAVEEKLAQAPQLAAAWRDLQAIETATWQPSAEDLARAERVTQKVLAPARQSLHRWQWLAFAAAAVVALFAVGTQLHSSNEGTSSSPASRAVAVGSTCRAEHTPVETESAGARLTLLRGEARRDSEDSWTLVSGSLVTEGVLTVHALRETIRTDGEVLISVEPSQAFTHVSAASQLERWRHTMLTWNSKQGTRNAGWKTAALMVFVAQGSAVALGDDGVKVTVPEGTAWAREKTPASSKATQALAAANPKAQTLPLTPFSEVSKSFDLESLEWAVSDRGWQMTECFYKWLLQNQKLEGKVTLILTVEPHENQGRLINTEMDTDYTMANPWVASCVMTELQQVKFPAPKNGAVRFAYPLEFEARGAVDGGVSRGAALALPAREKGNDKQYRVVMMHDRAAKVDIAGSRADGTTVEVVEFTDLAVGPFTKKGYEAMKQVRTELGSKVRYRVKFNPLPREGSNGRQAAAAALAAGQQGKMFEFIELCFANPENLSRGDLVDYARRLRLNVASFTQAMDSPQIVAQVDADIAEAKRIGATAVPAYYINGREVMGARPVENFRQIINEALHPAK
ncbi:MAG: AgmX/PglI C-terminal domain-containing protein [Myxococcaceae bacterium]|nr:AgmX/PglI C-terminal domain-containing protein [Myxococcaceae bacterium]